MVSLLPVGVDELAESIGTLADFVGVLLNETRKYGAAVILMNQSYVTLPQEVRQVILGNCRSQIALSLGVEDAAVAARIMGSSVAAEDIQRLRPYQAYARLAVGGGQAAPCLLRTLPPLRAEEAVARRPKPTPPAEIADWQGTVAARPETELSLEALASWARTVAPEESETAGNLLRVLQGLSEAQYAALLGLRQRHNAWWLEQVRREPGIVENKERRIWLRSRLRYGIPWWQSDADYLRAGDAAARAAAERAAEKAAEKAAALSLQASKAAARVDGEAVTGVTAEAAPARSLSGGTVASRPTSQAAEGVTGGAGEGGKVLVQAALPLLVASPPALAAEAPAEAAAEAPEAVAVPAETAVVSPAPSGEGPAAGDAAKEATPAPPPEGENRAL